MHNGSVTGPRVDTETIQAAGRRHKKPTRAAPVHAELDNQRGGIFQLDGGSLLIDE
jgi:hypothetical protein